MFQFPLVDVPAPLRYREEKMLIDLTNSPDLVRTPDLNAQPCGREVSTAPPTTRHTHPLEGQIIPVSALSWGRGSWGEGVRGS